MNLFLTLLLDDLISVVPKILEWSISIAILVIGLIVLVRWLRELMKQMVEERVRMEGLATKEREAAAAREAALNAEVRELFVQNLQVIQSTEQAMRALRESSKDGIGAVRESLIRSSEAMERQWAEITRMLDRLENRIDGNRK